MLPSTLGSVHSLLLIHSPKGCGQGPSMERCPTPLPTPVLDAKQLARLLSVIEEEARWCENWKPRGRGLCAVHLGCLYLIIRLWSCDLKVFPMIFYGFCHIFAQVWDTGHVTHAQPTECAGYCSLLNAFNFNASIFFSSLTSLFLIAGWCFTPAKHGRSAGAAQDCARGEGGQQGLWCCRAPPLGATVQCRDLERYGLRSPELCWTNAFKYQIIQPNLGTKLIETFESILVGGTLKTEQNMWSMLRMTQI